MIVVTTAPSYLFWRCAPPELRVAATDSRGARRHRAIRSSRSARTAHRRRARRCGSSASMSCVMGECEEVLVRLAETPTRALGRASPVCVAARQRRHRRPGRAAGRRYGPAAGACAGRPRRCGGTRIITTASTAAPARPRRRDGGVARLPLSLHLLRQGEFPRPLPPPSACDDPRRTRRADRGGRDLRLSSSTRSSCPGANCSRHSRAPGRIRRADPHRSVAPRHARSARARRAASRSRPASRA